MSEGTESTTSTWRGSSREQRDAERRDRLIQAGLEIFGTTGYQTSTVTRLCSMASVSTRSFYELFSHRSDLLLAVYLHICDELLQALRTLPPLPSDSLHRWLRDAVEVVLGPLLADLRKIRILEIEMVGVSDDLEQSRRDTTRAITDALGDWQRAVSGAGDPLRRALLATFIEGGMSEALVAYARHELPSDVTADEFLDQVAALIESLLVP